jgi:hypothetical protein
MMNRDEFMNGGAHIGIISYSDSPPQSVGRRVDVRGVLSRKDYTHDWMTRTIAPRIKRISQRVSHLQIDPLFGQAVLVTVGSGPVTVVSIFPRAWTTMSWINAYITGLCKIGVCNRFKLDVLSAEGYWRLNKVDKRKQANHQETTYPYHF